MHQICFANIFSQTVACLFVLVVSFAEQKFLIFMKFNLTTFSSVDCTFISKKSLPNARSP